ncbi:hypothetical protein GH714_000251 [Hevea brasiliensis]|uniref:Uncharacterized protein n=1 Tax=Hevea brasiliensis TaxID=3981 RepID=A0A6A6M969_HEVBR|nr:hypothetical protein GH714_000251 [Hevea brasiliensis]
MTTKKSSRKMRGFMCQSTAVCRVSDPCSVIVPRRPQRTLQQLLDNSSSTSRMLKKSTNNHAVKCTRLVESPIRFLPPATNRSVLVPSMKKQDINIENNQENRPKPMLLPKPASSDQVFQDLKSIIIL